MCATQREHGSIAELTEREPHALQRSRRRRNAADRVADLRIRREAWHAVITLVERVARELVPLLLVIVGQRDAEYRLHLCGGIVPGSHRRQPSDIRLNASHTGR